MYTEEQLSDMLSEDDVVDKGTDYTVFECVDGTNVMQVYTSNVRVEEGNGILTDVDNTLEKTQIDGRTVYTNVNGFSDVSLPEKLSPETPVCIFDEGNYLSFLPVFDAYQIKNEPEINKPASDNTDRQTSRTDKNKAAAVLAEKQMQHEAPAASPEAYDNSEPEEESSITPENGEPAETDGETSIEDTILVDLPVQDNETGDQAAGDEEVEAVDDIIEESKPADEITTESETDGADEEVIGVETNEVLTIDGVIEESVEDLYFDEEEKTVGIRYGTPDPNIVLEYFPIDAGVKENIILNDVPDSNVFSFVVKAKGRYLEKEHRGVLIKDRITDKTKAVITEPYMTDASGKEDNGYSEELEYSIQTIDADKGIFQVDLTVDWDYLKDKDRVYPVVIDPTTYTANNSTGVKDVYVLEKHSTENYYNNGVTQMVLGWSGVDGICRTYMQFPQLQAKVSGKYINSATLKLKENNNTKPYAKLGIYRVTQSWTPSKITYKNKASYNSTAITTKQLAGGTNSHTLTITSLVQGWAKGTYSNYGLLIKATVENSSTKNWCSLFGARASTAGNRPVLTVQYTSPSPSVPAKPTVSVDKQYIKKGTSSIKVSWNGATSNVFQCAQVKLVKYLPNSTYDYSDQNGGRIFTYTDIANSGTSGTYNLDTSKLVESKYSVLIRGKDKIGNAGSGTAETFWVDGTAPEVPKSVAITSERSSAQGHDEEAKVTVSITAGADLPAPYPSGIASHYVELYNAKTNQVLGSQTVTGNSAVFDQIASGIQVYAKVKSKDKAGNESAFKTSDTVNVKNTSLPNFDEEGSFTSNLDDGEIWRSPAKLKTTISWDADYDGNLGKITAMIVKADGSSAGAEYDEKEVLKTEEAPKKYTGFRVDKAFDLEALDEGQYRVIMKFYPESELNETSPHGKEMTRDLGIDKTQPTLSGGDDDTHISPSNSEPLTGMVQIGVQAADSLSGMGDTKVILWSTDGTYKVLTENLSVINLNTTEYDDGAYTVKYIVKDRAGNSVTTERQYEILNAAPTPKIVLNKMYGGADDDIMFRYSYPGGDASAAKVVKLQAAIAAAGTEPVDADFQDVVATDADVNGEATYQPQSLNDGKYDFCVRSVDESGAAGKVRKVTYVVDDTDPSVTISSPSDDSGVIGLVMVRGTVSDPYYAGYTIAYAQGETTSPDAFETVKEFDNTKNQTSTTGLLGVIDITDSETYLAGSKITVRIDATDKNGNHETVYRTVTKRESIDHAADFEIQKDSEGRIAAAEKQQAFNLTKNEAVYTPLQPVWLIDGKRAEQTNTGKFDFSDVEKFSDDSSHSLAVYDKGQDGTVSYGIPTS